MALTPDDIVGYEFKQSLRGYAVDEVDDLLDQLADQIEQSDRELDAMRERVRDAEARLASALETEATLKRTLVTAQEAAERSMAEAREQADELRQASEQEAADQLARAQQEAEQAVAAARDQAEEILAEARRQARAEVHDAHQRRLAVEERINTLRDLERRHRTQLERHLKEQLSRLEQLTGDAGEEAGHDGGEQAQDERPPRLEVRVRDDPTPSPSTRGDEPETGGASEVAPKDEGIAGQLAAAAASFGVATQGDDDADQGEPVSDADPWRAPPDDHGDAADDTATPAVPDTEPEPWRAEVGGDPADPDDAGEDEPRDDDERLWPRVDLRPDPAETPGGDR